jgi:UPF0249 protein VP2633
MKIITNADDFGLSEDVNKAIDIAIQNNKIDRATLMINMPYTSQAVNMAKAGNYLSKVGLHVNLIEGTPLTEKIRKTNICNDNGEFSGNFFKKLSNRLWINKDERSAIADEIEAQIRRFIDLGFNTTHLDSHQHTHTNLSILEIILKLAESYEFKTVRISRNIPKNEITGIKRIYKLYINKRIARYNKSSGGQFFGSRSDFKKENIMGKNVRKNALVEVMIHPIVYKGRIIDNFTREELF